VNENVSLVISRQVLTDVSNRLIFLPDEISKAVSHYTLDKVNHILTDYKARKQVQLQI
jgi:COP9 signalosome complex subunit 4